MTLFSHVGKNIAEHISEHITALLEQEKECTVSLHILMIDTI